MNIRLLDDTRLGNLMLYSGALAALAREIWTEHYTPLIGAAQVEYMLAEFQSAERIYADISEAGYSYLVAELPKEADTADAACAVQGEQEAHEIQEAGCLCGYCAFVPQGDYIFLSKLYVRLEYRGRGIARRFLDQIEALCATEDERFASCATIRLTVNKHNEGSIKAYQRMGFETVDSTVTDIGGGFVMDDYVMERSLS
jgi:ribosomal protein S18 acetylase RimI-like enzyme